MICPSCSYDGDPVATAGAIQICAVCGETVAVGPNGPQKAAYADVQSLSDVEFKTLRQERAKVLAKKSK